MTQRLNKELRYTLLRAIITHAFKARIDAMNATMLDIRSAAIAKLFTKAQIEAMRVTCAIQPNRFNAKVKVNCGGPTFTLSMFPGFNGERVSIPVGVMRLIGDSHDDFRLDLEESDALAKRTSEWGGASEALAKEAAQMAETVRGTLDMFKTVDQMKATWPDVMSIAGPILKLAQPIKTPGTSLLVPIAELNASLGLPADNDVLELTDAVAA